MSGWPDLSFLTFLPLCGVAALVLLRSGGMRPRVVALGSSGVTLVWALVLLMRFDARAVGMQFSERVGWIAGLGVEYHLGLDGLGLLMILLTVLLVPLAVWISEAVREQERLYYSLVLALQTGLLGSFTALNFFHWFLYWELSLIPAFFLVRLWGGPGRAGAAVQFFVYTMLGSVAMLLGFLALYGAAGTFDFLQLAEQARSGRLVVALGETVRWTGWTPSGVATVVCASVLLGFAVKVPLFPFHTWLPGTYAEAPTPVTLLLTGVMSKMGVYGLLRLVLPIFPEQLRTLMPWLLGLAVATIVFSALAAVAQRDLKRMLAYSSINHLGYCLLGVFAVVAPGAGGTGAAADRSAAIHGVLLQMFNHGLTAGALFAYVSFLERRFAGRRGLDDFGGLRQRAPVFCGMMGLAVFASLGLPGLNGFVGEFLIFKGVFALVGWAAVLSSAGLLVTAVFLLTLLQRVFAGPLTERAEAMTDLSVGERWLMAPLTGLMILLGVFPQSVLSWVGGTVNQLVERLAF